MRSLFIRSMIYLVYYPLTFLPDLYRSHLTNEVKVVN